MPQPSRTDQSGGVDLAGLRLGIVSSPTPKPARVGARERRLRWIVLVRAGEVLAVATAGIDGVGVEPLDDASEVGERTRRSVGLVDHDCVDLAGLDVGQQPLQSRPFHGAARDASVIISCADQVPAFVTPAGDIGLAGFLLCVERIEVLSQSLLMGFARVGCAAQALCGHQLAPHATPKKRVPDQRAPVIARDRRQRSIALSVPMEVAVDCIGNMDDAMPLTDEPGGRSDRLRSPLIIVIAGGASPDGM